MSLAPHFVARILSMKDSRQLRSLLRPSSVSLRKSPPSRKYLAPAPVLIRLSPAEGYIAAHSVPTSWVPVRSPLRGQRQRSVAHRGVTDERSDSSDNALIGSCLQRVYIGDACILARGLTGRKEPRTTALSRSFNRRAHL